VRGRRNLVRIIGTGFTNEFRYDSRNRRIALCQNGQWRYDLHAGDLCVASGGQRGQALSYD